MSSPRFARGKARAPELFDLKIRFALRQRRRMFKGKSHMKTTRGLTLAAACVFLSSCSVYMAAKQPDAKNLDLMAVGTPRPMLLAEFGPPAVSDVRKGRKYEIFKFVNGYSTGVKAGRAVFHGAADVVTLGLWEVVATPTEGIFSGDEMAFQVRYDGDERVDEVAVLKK